MKFCARCSTNKPLQDFAKDRSLPDGRAYTCKTCRAKAQKKYCAKNPDKRQIYDQEYSRNYRKANRAKINAQRREHSYLKVAGKNKQRANKLGAVPVWFEADKVRDFYKVAMERRRAGEDVVVDHIVPLGSPQVCGLHCADNLQYLTNMDNAVKSDVSWPDM